MKRLLSPEALEEAAAEVVELAEEQDVAVVLVGGLAMQWYGSSRLTGDIDFAAQKRLRGIPRGRPLAFGGDATKASNGVPLDLIVRRDDFRALYEAAIDDGGMVMLTADNKTIPVARPEYLAAMKMVAGRPKDEEDLRHLISYRSLNMNVTKRLIREHLGPYAVKEFDLFCEEAEWIAKRGNR